MKENNSVELFVKSQSTLFKLQMGYLLIMYNIIIIIKKLHKCEN